MLVIAPGVERFGEQPEVDALIRKYGYCGTSRALEKYRTNAGTCGKSRTGPPTSSTDHPKADSRFAMPLATSKAEMEGVHYAYADLGETLQRYDSAKLSEGWEYAARR